ncbi:MAG: AraC family ligand binding domain-containing protein, partial [Clostridia bacterium]|nr:AraC family ligand binding domain-containing protein [Clostridia bacterium]
MEYKHSYHHNAKEPLGLSVYSAGSQQCVPGQSWGPAVRDHYLLHYVSAGRGVYICGGREYPIAAGEAFVIYPGELVTYWPDDRDPWDYHWVGFVG